jgi:hypothetical protein
LLATALASVRVRRWGRLAERRGHQARRAGG